MLIHLSIKNLAIVKSLDIDFRQGLSVITGETGAGKSIAIDALGLCLGDRAEASLVRANSSKADVSATFDTTQLLNVQKWLIDNDFMDADEVPADLIIRRVISSEGRSKAYINGFPVPLQQLKLLASNLVSVHGQHAHQQLLKPDMQKRVVDNFADHADLLHDVKSHYGSLNQAHRELELLLGEQQSRTDRKSLLEYQVQELDEFALSENEFQELEIEHKKLSNSQTLLEQTQKSFYCLYDADENSAMNAVQTSVEMLAELQEHDAELSPIVAILNEALINLDEASNQLRAYSDKLEIDPMRMQQVEQRYSKALDFARKHGVRPEALYNCHQLLATELSELNKQEESLDALQQQLSVLNSQYLKSAKKLSESRIIASQALAQQVETHIQAMNMTKAKFSVQVDFDPRQSASSSGLDRIQFTISTNPGIAPDALDKVVSGGELSRVGLALQVISSKGNQIPTMIFDEVDTGISGPTASVVGKLLRKLGASCQVICVTHLPQVAASGNQQMFVTKFTDNETTETHMICLKENERIEELARLLAGDTLTDSAIANAKELLQHYQ
ncbi:DNA repair protein RecN [Aliiglaciecola sp. LCG003]|uniref:DNA repair protein RecN n=1 Tax=Aliiglaciecola sp. LCG003 TaxID=3053655 RepID=UPI002573FD43|nr:DNA repair protein RecN [Aliiglaciecola sp. LCG003]WJG08043.1 DNA repair protein RecN [Aliiglaciecola sp. LCG003]